MTLVQGKCPDCGTQMTLSEASPFHSSGYEADKWREKARRQRGKTPEEATSEKDRKLVLFRCPRCGLTRGYEL